MRELEKQRINTKLKIPRRYADASGDSKYYEEYTRKKGVVFSGSVGTGKTHEAVSLLKTIYQKEEQRGLFTTATELAMRLREGVGQGNLAGVIDEINSVEVLLIDDLGVESATDFFLEYIYVIINYRYNQMLPLLLTTNLTAPEFGEVYGQRILSRLTEMSEFIKLSGSDKRASKKK